MRTLSGVTENPYGLSAEKREEIRRDAEVTFAQAIEAARQERIEQARKAPLWRRWFAVWWASA